METGNTPNALAAPQLVFSDQTINIIKNFASIQKGMLFRRGSTQTTTDLDRTIFAEASFSEDIPREFAVFDCIQWLNVLDTIKTPILELHDNYMVITEANSGTKIRYMYAAPSMISVENRKVAMPGNPVKFEMTDDDLSKLRNMSRLFQTEEFTVKIKGTELEFGTESTSSNSYLSKKEIENPLKVEANLYFKMNHLKLIKGSYQVELYEAASRFTHTELNVNYWVVAQAKKKNQSYFRVG